MVLEPRKSSAHNAMAGRKAFPPPSKVTDFFGPPTKKQKRDHAVHEKKLVEADAADSHSQEAVTPPPTTRAPPKSPARTPRKARIIPDSEPESDVEPVDDEPPQSTQTDLEQALPAVKTDREAIEEYEAYRAANAAELGERLGKREWIKGKSSIYVDAFYLALETVLEEESHLFNEAEMKVFDDFRAMSYEAQYLYVRLFLRKTSAWFRIRRLGYYSDIANMDGAIAELFLQRCLPESTEDAQMTPGELAPPEGTVLDTIFAFADSSADHIHTLEEASSLLLLDELKGIARDAKVQGRNKSELLRALRRTSGRQTGLNLQRSETEDSVASGAESERGGSPVKSDPANRDAHFTRKILEETGPCIRLSLASFKLFERVHLVFYRSTEWTEKSLTTIILAQIARRNFPHYIVSRSATIFPSRSLLLEFEASLRTQFRIDNLLEFNGTPTREMLQTVLDIFDEIYPRWTVLLEDEQRKEDSIYLSGEGAYLRRLSPAWVYTRIVHKGTWVLGTGKFKEHRREHELLSELLNQRLFHASRRGAWYQRKALLEEHYMKDLAPSDGRSDEQQKKHWKRIAMETCEEGLQDNLVHVIYHYDLQKRLIKLEKALRVPKRQQHEFGHAILVKPLERTVAGIRIERPSKDPPRPASTSGRRDSADVTSTRRGAKTIWLDPREENGECSVEAMCLSWYREHGWKGYHSEGGIVRTLFALLFYEVLFTYVPNVFQTPFQTCPLDLHTDAFFATRMSEINARLAAIANGEAATLIRTVWEREAERKTCVVGLDWNFALPDLLEIAECMQGQQLATLCKVMAQEYAERGGGVPDLFLWKPEEKVCCFAEVKSENDRLSDTQRLWIHVLMGAGIQVELCAAVASEVREVAA